jgi:replicative superfamily II helicase
LQQGKDVVVQAPTGSGKTYIFELLYPNLKTQAVFTVPTRALTRCIQKNRRRRSRIISGL